MPETLTPDDLDRIFLRAQTQEGRWVTISAQEATDAQFDAWAQTRRPIIGDPAPWLPAERANFCNELWQEGALVMLKKEGEE